MSTLDDLLTAEDIAYFRSLGMDADHLAWCEAEVRTWGECIDEHAGWLLARACARLTDAQFDAAVTREPRVALERRHACGRLNDEQFDALVSIYPLTALKWKHASNQLTADQFTAALATAPASTRGCRHVLERIASMKLPPPLLQESSDP